MTAMNTAIYQTTINAKQLLIWAREIRDDPAASDKSKIRAYRTLIQHSTDAHEKARAQDLLHLLENEDE